MLDMSSFFRSIRRRIPIILITRFRTNHQRVRAEHRKRIQKRLKKKLRTSVQSTQSESNRKTKRLLAWNQIDVRKMSLFVIIAFFGLMLLMSAQSFVQFQWHLSSDTLKKWTAHMSTETFVSALSMEVPQLTTYMNAEGIEAPKASHIAVEMVTSFNPEDPRSLIRREIPGFAFFDGEIVSSGEGVNYTDIPIESSPPLDIVMAQREAVIEEEESAEEEGAGEENTEEAPDREEGETEEDTQTSLTTGDRDVVYIYHTHNRESWIPHIPSATTADEAFHDEVNIKMVGEGLGEEL
jgi:stage II sporulation protein P